MAIPFVSLAKAGAATRPAKQKIAKYMTNPLHVIPAKAGIHLWKSARAHVLPSFSQWTEQAMDSGFRRNDGCIFRLFTEQKL
jgi:hypothetical protein